MTKQFLITVRGAENTKFSHPPEAVDRNLRFVVEAAIRQMTTGPVPEIEVLEVKNTSFTNARFSLMPVE